jgi:hypothetical protein
LSLLISISFLHFHSIFCGHTVSLYKFLCSSNVFSSFSVSFFFDYCNLSSSLSPILFFRYFFLFFFFILSCFSIFWFTFIFSCLFSLILPSNPSCCFDSFFILILSPYLYYPLAT